MSKKNLVTSAMALTLALGSMSNFVEPIKEPLFETQVEEQLEKCALKKWYEYEHNPSPHIDKGAVMSPYKKKDKLTRKQRKRYQLIRSKKEKN